MSEVSRGFEALTFVIYKIKSFSIDHVKELHLWGTDQSGTVLGVFVNAIPLNPPNKFIKRLESSSHYR